MHSLCRRLAVSFRSHRVTLTLKPSCHTHTKAMHSLCRRLAVSESIVRLAVSEALSTSPHVRPWTQAAMGAVAVLPEGPMRSMYLNLGLKVIYGWCELGTLPLCIQQQESIVQQPSLVTLSSCLSVHVLLIMPSAYVCPPLRLQLGWNRCQVAGQQAC
eukprot:1157779-Pelagomonas_calceolata.AAC.12